MDSSRGRQYRRHRRIRPKFFIWIALLILLIVALCLLLSDKAPNGIDPTVTIPVPSPTEPEDTPEPTPTPGLPDFFARSTDTTKAEAFNFDYEMSVNGEKVSDYTSSEIFNFGDGRAYSALEGVIGFRGGNFRNSPAYGTANITRKVISNIWNVRTGSLKKGEGGSYSGAWTGSGWTGQPLLVKWPASTKAVMNMYESAKNNDNLVEVIYATMDGNIYFLDLETGKQTRDTLTLGVPFKGAGALDPRGYPILYLGSGDHYSEAGKESRARIISLIDCKTLYEFGAKGDPFALRSWTAYDSSPLVCADADTLVYPGENGILYVLKLNTNYNETSGTLTMNPDKMVRLRYSAPRTRDQGYYLGYEGSAAAYKNYVFLTENSGLMHCVDLNTMKVVWVQDIWDDTNASPVLEVTAEGAFLYIGNTLDNKANANGAGEVAFFKLDAATGEKLWDVKREVYTTSHVTGGVMTSAVLGENELSGLVFFVFTSYGNGNRGDFMAVNKDTGAIVWETKLSAYAWSSPVAVYDKGGKGYLIQCNCNGDVCLIDGLTGAVLHTYNIPSNIEASPAVYNDIIIIGTRVEGIWGLRLE